MYRPEVQIFLFFPLSGLRCCLQLFHCLICYSSPPSSVSCLLLPVSLLSCLLHISLNIVSLGLPRLLLPCSRNYAAIFGSLSSAILYVCPAHCNLLLTNLSAKLLCTPVSSLTPPFFACLPSLLLLFFEPSCFRTRAAFVVEVRSEPRFPFRTGILV